MPLPNSTKQRIKQEAQAYGKLALEVGENNFGLIFGTYEKAATAEAGKAQGLVEALEKSLEWIADSGIKQVAIEDKKGMALYHVKWLLNEALTNYHSKVK